jgi:hypothetical protein
MLPHPLRLRSVCQASVSTIFACDHVALRYVRGIAKFLSSAGKRHAAGMRIFIPGGTGMIGSPISSQNEKPACQRAFVKLCHLRKSGAGEGARTLDPDLGKVVLYH